jgi:hypothetical protein
MCHRRRRVTHDELKYVLRAHARHRSDRHTHSPPCVRGARSYVLLAFLCVDVAFTIWPMILTGVAFFGTPSADELAAAPSDVVNATGGYYLYDISASSCRCCVATSYMATLFAFVGMALASLVIVVIVDAADDSLTTPGDYQWTHWYRVLLCNLIGFFLRPCIFFLFYYIGYAVAFLLLFLWVCPIVCPTQSAFFSNHFGAQFVQIYYTSIAGLNDLPSALVSLSNLDVAVGDLPGFVAKLARMYFVRDFFVTTGYIVLGMKNAMKNATRSGSLLTVMRT